MIVPYSVGLLAVRIDSKLLKHQIHVKVRYNDGPLVVRTDSKLSKHIEFMCKYRIVLVCWWFKEIRNLWNLCKSTLYCSSTSGTNKFEAFKTHRLHMMVPYNAGLLVFRIDSTFLKHRIPVKILYNAALLVARTDSKLSKLMKFLS